MSPVPAMFAAATMLLAAATAFAQTQGCGEASVADRCGKRLSDDYRLTAGGRSVEVVQVPAPEKSAGKIWMRPDSQPYSYANFVATGAVEVCVRSGRLDLGKAAVLPSGKAGRVVRVAGQGPVNDTTLKFTMTPPMTLVVEPQGRFRALVISANRPDGEVKRSGVKRFGPGYHQAGEISLGDGETLCLALGAWVEGWIKARGKDITVCGSGVLSGAPWFWNVGPRDAQGQCLAGCLTTFSGENITVRDVTFFSSWGWTLVLNGVTNAVVDNVKILGGRVLNDDGIDVCRAKDVVLRNAFVRCQDDCVAPKWWCENLVCTNMTLWTDAANAFRTGYECEPGASGLVYRNLLFKDIDVLHLSLNKNRPGDYWANCAIHIQPSRGQAMVDTVYEDIRFHEVGPEDIFLNVKTMPITRGFQFPEPGTLSGLVLRDIHLPASQGGMCVNLSAYDAAHPIRGVRFENVTGYGEATVSSNVEFRAEPPDGKVRPATWDFEALCRPPQVFESEYPEKDGVRPIFYAGLPYQGKETRVFAYLAVPEVKKGEKVPGIVLVHGGDGSAFRRWAKFWCAHGYAAISMDTCGCVSGNEFGNEHRGHRRHAWAGPKGWGGFTEIGRPIADQWMYHAVADVILAHSLLRARPEVDAARIGLTGVSWGGVLTCVAAGIDPRFDFAAPVYGCGFLDEDSYWKRRSSDGGVSYLPAQFQVWCDLFDPRHFLPAAKMPFLWVDGSNDFAFPLPSLQKSVDLPRTPHVRATRVRMAHNHSAISEHPQELVDFADTRAGRRGRRAYPCVTDCTLTNGVVCAACTAGDDRLARAELNFTTDGGEWEPRDWKMHPMALDGTRAEAKLPDGTTAWYVNFFTADGKCVSGELFR